MTCSRRWAGSHRQDTECTSIGQPPRTTPWHTSRCTPGLLTPSCRIALAGRICIRLHPSPRTSRSHTCRCSHVQQHLRGQSALVGRWCLGAAKKGHGIVQWRAGRGVSKRSEGNAHTSRSSEQVGSPLRTSAGTSQRVPPGWALLAHPACLVLDEPPAGTRCACCDAPAHHGGLACFRGRTRDARSGGIAEFASGASPAPSLA